MKKLVILFLLLFLCTPAYAVSISDNVNLGGEAKLRGYDIQNFWDFDYHNDTDNYSTFRLYSSIYADVNLSDNVSGRVQFTNQTYGEGVGVGDNVDNKVFADNAYINVKNLFTMPVDLRMGRQNLIYGSGFVLLDGQSQFASTSIYFDGVKLSVHLGENAVLDGLYFKDQENKRQDDPKDDITLAGAYLTAHCPLLHGQQEIYALNKNDQGLDKDIWVYGLRLSDKFDFGLDYSAEIAYQAGDAGKIDESSEVDDTDKPIIDKCTGEAVTICKETSEGVYENVPTYEQKTVTETTDYGDQEALGYKLQLGYTAPVAAKPRFFIGYTSMSGDKSSSKDYNSWDVFYGGFPQFGDLLAWMYVNGPSGIAKNPLAPGGEASYTNLNLATAGLSTKIDKFSAEASYTMIKFNRSTAFGNDFGDYYQLKASYQYTKELSFSMYAAMIEPGDAFKDQGMKDEAYELYWETSLKF